MSQGRPSQLPPKLEAVLVRLCENLGPITKTRAVKLPYLVDVLAHRLLGRSITEATYQTWDYGVVANEAYHYFTHGDPRGAFTVKPHPFSESGQQIRVGAADAGCLDDVERQIVDAVANAYGAMDAVSLGQLTKSMNSDLDVEAWGSNHPAAVDDDAYARMSSAWADLFERLPHLDLSHRDSWGVAIDDPRDYVRRALGTS